ncbi:SDR family NAD(P)-dependent oxidoreductase [Diaminobutyricibacter sp. McL0618]|uniref:SDR family NAD(P)-dependent oxidoreductase n=1 Tax=Leifsonia sp. McL0618 TaxID=3415677 RepID=UPI003CE8598D
MALVLVTGASGGLGLAAASELAAQGHEVVVHSRTAARRPASGAGLVWKGAIVGDLSDFGETEDVAEQAKAFGTFDAVIHNAGTIGGRGLREVNIIAPYVLTALMPKPGRLVYISSSMHRGGSTDLGRLESGAASYSDTKLWVTALALATANRWERTTAHAVDPGWVPTRMGGAGAPDDLTAGHQTQAWLASHPEVMPATGGYWYHMRTERPAPAAADPGFQEGLLQALRRSTGLDLD